MAVDLRRLVQGLQDEPFRRDVSSVTLDQLSEQQRLQLLSDVIAELSGSAPNQGPDIHYETQGQTVERISKSLDNLKFDPKSIYGIEKAADFYSRLVQGEQYLIFKTLEYLVCNNIDALKKRAYLAKFMVKIDVPSDFRSDSDVSILYDEYTNLIQQFIQVHKESIDNETQNLLSSESAKSMFGNVDKQPNKKPISSTFQIQEQITKLTGQKNGLKTRLEAQKTRVQNALAHERDSEKFLLAIKKLRSEHQIASQIRAQIAREKHEVEHLEHQLGAGGLRNEFEMTRESENKSAIQMVEKVDGDLKSLEFRKEKISLLIDQKKKELGNLQAIARQPLFPRSELANLRDAIEREQSWLNNLIEIKTSRMKNTNKTNDSTLQLYRQQANALSIKKDALDSDLNDKRAELHSIEQQITKIKVQVESESMSLENHEVSDVEIEKLKGDLKSRHEIYKKKRDERNKRHEKLEKLKTDLKNFENEESSLTLTATSLEKKYGVPGFITKLADTLSKDVTSSDQDYDDELRSIKQQLDNAISNHLTGTEMATIMEKAKRVFLERKETLKPVIEQVNTLKKQQIKLTSEREECRLQYDALVEQLETTSAALESNVQGLRKAVSQEAERYYKLDTNLTTIKAQNDLLADGTKIKVYLENWKNYKIELEAEARRLKTQLRQIRDAPSDKNKMLAWQNLLNIFEAKQKVVDNFSG